MTQILTLNPVAAAILDGMTRLRVNKKTRGGVMYAAIRPSHRVAGRNPMIKVEPVAGESSLTAEFPSEVAAMCEGLPELKNNHTYVMFDIGYGWWTLREPEDANDQTKPLITVAKGRKQKAAPADAPVDSAKPAETAETADTKPEATGDAVVEQVADVPVNTATAEQTPTAAPTEGAAVAEISQTIDASAVANVGDTAINTATAETTATPADAETAAPAENAAPAETTPAAAAASAKPARVRTRKAAAKTVTKADAEVDTKTDGAGIVVHVIG